MELRHQLRARLQKIDSQVLTAALQVGTPLAALLQAELARRTNAPPPAAPAERTIGVLLPLSGRFAAYGLSVQQGVELARSVETLPVSVRFAFRDTALNLFLRIRTRVALHHAHAFDHNAALDAIHFENATPTGSPPSRATRPGTVGRNAGRTTPDVLL